MMSKLKKNPPARSPTRTSALGTAAPQTISMLSGQPNAASSANPPSYGPLSISQNPSTSQSRAMMLARTVVGPSSERTVVAKEPNIVALKHLPSRPAALISKEQYWAARALTAEAALAVRGAFHQETYVLSASHEQVRARELAELHRVHNERHATLERLVLMLVASLVSFISVVLYIFYRQYHDLHTSRWNLPSHFTIPVLSPFTSVVEHETSVFSARLVMMIVLVLAALAYVCFRYWISYQTRK